MLWYVPPTCGRDLTRQSLVVRIPDLWSGLDQAKPVVRIPDLWSGYTRQSLVVRTPVLWLGHTRQSLVVLYPRPVVGTYQAEVRIPDLWSGRTRQSLVVRTPDLWSGFTRQKVTTQPCHCKPFFGEAISRLSGQLDRLGMLRRKERSSAMTSQTVLMQG